MGFKPLTYNTPPEEEAHIFAEDDAAIFQSIFGEDGVFAIGDRMKATVINNNQVRVGNGILCVGGHIGRTVYGDYSDMTIENGEISKNRNDIITAVFSTTGEKGIDEFKIEVKKGTPGVVAEDPELTKENLYEGGKLREFPLWRVKLEGINIIGVEQMFKIIPKIPDLEEKIELLNGKLEDSGWVDCTLGTNISIDNPENGKPKVRKIGNMVILSGTIKSNTTWSDHEALIKIPDGYRPKKYERFICAATGQYMHRLDIPPSGTCTDYILNGKRIPSGGWLQLEGIWYV